MPLGFSVVIPREDGTQELDGLFVEPAQMQRGFGRFYERVGFQVVCATETRFGNTVRMQRLL